MRKKGFTLIEIIVTIALLAIIGTVLSINIVALNKKQQEKEKQRQASIVASAAEAYFDTTKQSGCVSVQELLENNYIRDKNIGDFTDKYVSIEKDDSGNIIFNSYTSSKQCNKSIKKYTVSFDANGGSGNIQSVEKNYGATIDLKPFKNRISRTGYTLAGWTESSQGSKKIYNNEFKITKNTTLYALWNINKYNVSYNASGGTNAPTTQRGEYNTEITLANSVPLKEGHTFLGWSLSSEGDAAYASGSRYRIPANNTELYAAWQINTYTITYETNGGSPIEQQSYVYNTQTNAPQSPSRNQDIFLGWYEDEALTKKHDFGKMPANNITLYAKWKSVYNLSVAYEGATVLTDIPATISADDILKIQLKANDKYIYSNTTCTNITYNYNKSTSEITLSKPTGDVSCTINYYKAVYISLNTNAYYNMNTLKNNLKNNKIELDYSSADRHYINNKPGYEITNIDKADSNHKLVYGGVLGDKFFYQQVYEVENRSNPYTYLKVYNIKDDYEIAEHQLTYRDEYLYNSGTIAGTGNGCNREYGKKRVVTEPMLYTYVDGDYQESRIYFASQDYFDLLSQNCHSGCASNDSYYETKLNFYYYDKYSDDYIDENNYIIYSSENTGKCHSPEYSWTNNDNVLTYYLLTKYVDNPSCNRNCDGLNLSRKIFNNKEIKSLTSNKIFDYDELEVPNEVKEALTVEKIANSSYYTSKAINSSGLGLVSDDNQVYYFKDDWGEFGVIFYYKDKNKTVNYDRVVYSEYSRNYHIEKIDKDVSNYYSSYYIIDLADIKAIESTYSNGEAIGNYDFSKYKKIYLNYNNQSLPKALQNGTALSDYDAITNKIISDNNR